MKRLGILLFSLGLFFIKGWAAEWQWSVPVSKVIAPETGWHPQAFLWIPEDCMQVRAVMIGTHNMCEETLFENELFRCEMKEAGVAPEEVDYINAHGTSTHHNDLFETRAICYALGDAAENVVVNSTKSMIGHLLGAAGAVEFVVCVKSILDNFIHQTVGTKNVDPECGLNYAVGAPVEKEVNCVISNSLGFGGHNVSLLVKRFEE